MFKFTLQVVFVFFTCTLFAQQSSVDALPIPTKGEVVRCYSTEYNEYLEVENPSRTNVDDFERWMSQAKKQVAQQETLRNSEPTVYTIPIIFHIIHRGESVGSGTNISADLVYAQIEQLNNDYRRIAGTLGFSNHPDAADSQIEFCPALYDESGNELAEPGIERINAIFSFPPLGLGIYTGIVEFDDLVKRNTYWNPNDYMNFWTADIGPVLLGYAQFPEAPCLEGVETGNGDAETDGVVCNYNTVGGEAAPGSNASYALGRTATHEVGHWLGLRHIWGDTACDGDDFVHDTPNAADSNSGCPTTANSCDDSNNPYFNGTDPNDMVQNYMDYTNDACMNIFTNGQRERMRIVMGELSGRDCEGGSPRRASLAASTKCTASSSIFLAEQTAADQAIQEKENTLDFAKLNNDFSKETMVNNIYPNPATNRAIIALNENAGAVTVQVFNQVGQAVQLSAVFNDRQINLNTTNLGNGLYFVAVTGAKGTQVHSLVIKK